MSLNVLKLGHTQSLALRLVSAGAPAAEFVRLLAQSKASAAPAAQRAVGIAAFVLRWSALLAFAAARTVAASLLLPLSGTATLMETYRSSATSWLTFPGSPWRSLLPRLWAGALGPRSGRT